MQFVDSHLVSTLSPLRKNICTAYRRDEDSCVEELLIQAKLDIKTQANITAKARQIVLQMRETEKHKKGVDSLMKEYDLSSAEGIALMCLAESLLRIPDKSTADQLIQDKLAPVDWGSHLAKDKNWFLNAATWGLMLTGKILKPKEQEHTFLSNAFRGLIKRSGEPVIRKAIGQALKLMAKQFVMGETILDAMNRAKESEKAGFLYSYDMLGEAARTKADAEQYFNAYLEAIENIAKTNRDPINGAGISIKLSALHPRYEFRKKGRLLAELLPIVIELAIRAKQANIGLTIDAEEADKLDISLDIIEALAFEPSLQGWNGLGLAVQAYQKRALPLLEWLNDLSKRAQRKFMVRLVKGAYWDSEIKLAQELGLAGFPVFTRKQATDVSYIACAKYLLSNSEAFYPQFATHNALTVATILHLASSTQAFEFQRLHGMGESLYQGLINQDQIKVRVYAPVGGHKYLLAYLVRRLLENGANTSFINRINDKNAPVDSLIENPIEKLSAKKNKAHPKIALPKNIYGEKRLNSSGIDLSSPMVQVQLQQELDADKLFPVTANLAIKNYMGSIRAQEKIYNPANNTEILGYVEMANHDDVNIAINTASDAFNSWSKEDISVRSACLIKMAELLEANQAALIIYLVKEAGKTIPNAISEIREGVDFCRYYAQQAIVLFEKQILPGPTGEENILLHESRGVIACISPWNFPLAIFLGQISAALVTGNAVIAKPAQQTPLIAHFVIQLFHQAGIPKETLIYLPGKGGVIGTQLTADERIAGVIFTGSNATAKHIQRSLAAREGAIVPLIAETGGQNCMIVDSSALLEQLIPDIVMSAFDSAGQRCSALRVVYVQAEIFSQFEKMLIGAMAELTVDNPAYLSTDIGPVIDNSAQASLAEHIQAMEKSNRIIYKVKSSPSNGSFLNPTVIEIDNIKQLKEEVFGPILHVIKFERDNLNSVYDQINSSRFGLTFGIHSRIVSQTKIAAEKIKAGNIYINRNMVGAVVGVQPFGGQGLSGTGPKAGGPNYLHSLVTEKTVSTNITAFGGNASLLSLDDDMD